MAELNAEFMKVLEKETNHREMRLSLLEDELELVKEANKLCGIIFDDICQALNPDADRADRAELDEMQKCQCSMVLSMIHGMLVERDLARAALKPFADAIVAAEKYEADYQRQAQMAGRQITHNQYAFARNVLAVLNATVEQGA